MPPKKDKKVKRARKSRGQNKTIDEGVRTFEVKLKELPYTSEKFTMGSVQWQVSMRRKMIPVENKDKKVEEDDARPKREVEKGDANPKKEIDYVAVTLENLTKNDKWQTKMKGKFSVVKQDKKAKDQTKEFACVFHRCNTKKDLNMFFKFHDVATSTAYVQDGKIRVELKFNITTSKVNLYPHYDFKQPTEFSDGKIRVNGHIFYVNKKYLAMHSKYFGSMFFGDFKEKDADVVELKDVSNKVFEEFLQIIYPSRHKIEQKRLHDMLMLGDRYQVPTVTALCEDFLLSKECHLTMPAKLRLSDKFNLIRLQTTLLRKMDDDSSVEKAKAISDLCPDLKAAIDRKSTTVKTARKPRAKAEPDNRMELD